MFSLKEHGHRAKHFLDTHTGKLFWTNSYYRQQWEQPSNLGAVLFLLSDSLKQPDFLSLLQ